jgi:hypothetical protein
MTEKTAIVHEIEALLGLFLLAGVIVQSIETCKRYRKVYTWQVSSIRHIINIIEFATLGGLPFAPPYWRIGVENHISAIISLSVRDTSI